MPTYEYQCKSCNHRFEVWQKMADEPLTTCPECQGSIRRVLFPAGIVFKGSGFYKTDHANSTSSNSESDHHGSTETKESSTAKAETTGGSETKATSSEKSSTSTATSDSKIGTAAAD